jgi:hypothetical protein
VQAVDEIRRGGRLAQGGDEVAAVRVEEGEDAGADG